MLLYSILRIQGNRTLLVLTTWQNIDMTCPFSIYKLIWLKKELVKYLSWSPKVKVKIILLFKQISRKLGIVHLNHLTQNRHEVSISNIKLIWFIFYLKKRNLVNYLRWSLMVKIKVILLFKQISRKLGIVTFDKLSKYSCNSFLPLMVNSLEQLVLLYILVNLIFHWYCNMLLLGMPSVIVHIHYLT